MFALIFLLCSWTFTLNADQGSGIDPDGARIAAAGDHRCTIDRNGTCVGGFTADSGGGMDPNG